MISNIKVGLVDDHVMLRQGLAELLIRAGFEIVLQAKNGKDMIDQLQALTPDVILMDLSMPIMDGVETTTWLKQNKPHINVLALSMNDDEFSVIQMVKAGARGYVLKDMAIENLEKAIRDVYEKGYYFSDIINGRLISNMHAESQKLNPLKDLDIKPRELEFLKYCCTELGYKEIGKEMNVSTRTVDGYREMLFKKFGVRTRTGLILFAIKHKLIQIPE